MTAAYAARKPAATRPGRLAARRAGSRAAQNDAEQGERRDLVAVGQRRVDVGGRRQAVGQARPGPRRAASSPGRAPVRIRSTRRQGREEPEVPSVTQ